MSGSLPTTLKPRDIRWRSLNSTLTSTAASLKRQARTLGAHRWGFELLYPVSTEADFRDLLGFLAAQRGSYETFTWTPPADFCTTRGVVSSGAVEVLAGSAAVNNGAGYAVDVDEIVVDTLVDWTPAAGDWCSFANHTQAYYISAYAANTITISPALQDAVVDDEAITQEFWGTSVRTGYSATSPAVDGWTGELKRGDFIKFASHNKVYMLAEDVAGPGFSEVNLTLNTPLIETPVRAGSVTTSSVPFSVALANDSLDALSLAENLHEITIQLVEVP